MVVRADLLPGQQDLHNFMFDSWSVQANVHFEVDVDDCGDQPYDKSGEGYLDIHAPGTTTLTDEERWLHGYTSLRGAQDYKVAAVRQFNQSADGLQQGDSLGYALPGGIAFIHTYTNRNKLHTIGHEVGHLLLRLSKADHNDSTQLNLMNARNWEPEKPEIRFKEWDYLQLH